MWLFLLCLIAGAVAIFFVLKFRSTKAGKET